MVYRISSSRCVFMNGEWENLLFTSRLWITKRVPMQGVMSRTLQGSSILWGNLGILLATMTSRDSHLIQYRYSSWLIRSLLTQINHNFIETPMIIANTNLRLRHRSPPPQSSECPLFPPSDLIGKGFSSEVYRSKLPSGEKVAVKVIDTSKLSEMDRELVGSEIAVLKKLKGQSQYILEVVEVSQRGAKVYITSELCDFDLGKVFERGPICQFQAIQIMEKVIRGYMVIGYNSIIHRDLKPANIFIKSNQIKIGDFGFAVTKGRCRPHHNVGSPYYMSPEALKDTEYSFESDIWALGVIYYQMLFGTKPWIAEDESALLASIHNNPVSTLLQNTPLSKNSQLFLLKALNPNPKVRMSLKELQKFSLRTIKPIREILFKEPSRKQLAVEKKMDELSDSEKLKFQKAFRCQILLCEYLIDIYSQLKERSRTTIKLNVGQVVDSILKNIKNPSLHPAFNIKGAEEFKRTLEFKMVTLHLIPIEEVLESLIPNRQGETPSVINYKELKHNLTRVVTGIQLASTNNSGNLVMSLDERDRLLVNRLLQAKGVIEVAIQTNILEFSVSPAVQLCLQQFKQNSQLLSNKIESSATQKK